MRWVLALTAFLGILSICSAQGCDQLEFQKCMTSLQQLTATAMTIHQERELKEVCNGMKKMSQCAKDFSNRCLPGDQQAQIRQSIKPSDDISKEKCSKFDGNGAIATHSSLLALLSGLLLILLLNESSRF